MNVPLLDLTEQYRQIKDDIDPAMAEVVASQRFILGPGVQRFEEAMADFIGVAHAIGCASGTDALLLPLKALAAAPGDEVVVPAFTFFATAGAVWNAGLRPAFCDIDSATFNVSAETLEAACTDRTRAVLPVHLFGQIAEMTPVNALAERLGLFVLEDAAQAIGATQTTSAAKGAGQVTDLPLGSSETTTSVTRAAQPKASESTVSSGAAAHAGAFSFFPTKNLGGFGDGGLITTDDSTLADRLKKLRVHGGLKMYHHEFVGTNSRLDALQAAVLLAKLPHLSGWTRARQANAAFYDEALAGIDGVQTPVVLAGNAHVYNQYTIRAHRRDELREYLGNRGIGSGVYYPVPLHLQECFVSLGCREGQFPESERACREVLSLPVFPELGEERAARVAEAVREFYAG